MPLAYVLTFKAAELDLGLMGIWYGLTAGYGIVTFASLAAVLCGDWQKASDNAVATATKHQSERKATSSANEDGGSRRGNRGSSRSAGHIGSGSGGNSSGCSGGGSGSGGRGGKNDSTTMSIQDNDFEDTPLLAAT